MRRRLYKYFSDRKWADAFLEGEVFFNSLSYFRDYEDEAVRGDQNEGTSIYQPVGGLVGFNHTQGKPFVLPNYSFNTTAKQDEIFVFCASRIFSEELGNRFQAAACIEVPTRIFCHRVKAALPSSASFFARRVDYYKVTEEPKERWALPDLIATSKLQD